MKKTLLFLMVCFNYFPAFAQENQLAMVAVEKNVKVRNGQMDSTAEVANWAISKYHTETDIVRAIYSWVTGNIRYDKTGSFAMNAGVDREAKIHVAFAKRKGVCENFAAIFNDICKRAGLTSFTVEGYTRINGFVQNGSHSWVTVKIDNDWYFFDPTWDEGGRFQYFMVAPETFITTHLPFDPLWQFLREPAGYLQYTKENRAQGKGRPFQYKDSLAAYLRLDSLQKWEAAERRILQAVPQNTQSHTNLKLVKMNLEIERQGEQVKWYNEAIENLNQSVTILNDFIAYRNNLFTPLKTDTQLSDFLLEPEKKIAAALELLNKTDQSKAVLLMGTWQVRERIASFTQKLKTQKDFLATYLHSPLDKREALFYK